MISFLKSKKKILVIMVSAIVLVTSFILGIHNATLYNPSHGFDGIDHVFYIKYLAKYWQIPSPDLGKETHQSPIYYVIGALLMKLTGNWKAAQYINIFVLWLIIIMVGLGLWKVFKKKDQVLIGMFSLVALPMLNIFPAMITNELLNTFCTMSSAISLLFVATSTNRKKLALSSLWFLISFVLGYWTKVSIILILPVFFVTYFSIFIKSKTLKKYIFASFLITLFLIIGLTAPMVIRARQSKNTTSNMIRSPYLKPRELSFYIRLDWIPKVDMYNTQYYSFLGAAWNSFWTDGHNAITPFIKFHKKSFILWSLGFILLPICLYGLYLLSKKNKGCSLVVNMVGIMMLLGYGYYNFNGGHYSAGRLTYEMGIVVPYAFGIAGATQNKKLKWIVFFLLSIQFFIMVSFFWILSWWHVTK